MEKIWESLKQHPYMVAAGVLVGLVLLWWIFSSKSATPVTTDNSAAQEYASQTAAATALSQAQIAGQTQDYIAAQEATTAQDNFAMQQNIAQIQANANVSAAQIGAGSQNLYTSAQENVADNQITANQNTTEYTSYLQTEAALAGIGAQVAIAEGQVQQNEYNTAALVTENTTNNETQLATNTAIINQENNQMYSNERVMADLIQTQYLENYIHPSNATPVGNIGTAGVIGVGQGNTGTP